MQAALLCCDHVLPEFQTQFGDYPEMFADLFPEFQWTVYDVINGHFPNELTSYDLFLCTGSRYSVYDQLDWIKQLKNLIQRIYDQEKYFIGCCFGHQILAEALGGMVAKSPQGWCVGVHTFRVNLPQAWMQPPHSHINLLMMCQDQVQRLPEKAELLAGNPTCPVGMFQVGHKMLGIQAHPEFTTAYDQQLMTMRAERMGAEVVAAGIQSLKQTVHRDVIRQWVLQFIQSVPE